LASNYTGVIVTKIPWQCKGTNVRGNKMAEMFLETSDSMQVKEWTAKVILL
jgi:hypothetical protein